LPLDFSEDVVEMENKLNGPAFNGNFLFIIFNSNLIFSLIAFIILEKSLKTM